MRKRSDSNKCFNCAKAKRQQQQKRLIGRHQEALLCAKATKRLVGTEINPTFW
ncbi:hypothetical protein [Lysinibacillus sp. G4S2]|uniref:hypothetical protein n=1 Tax=Lysinibacillus sp. G4S2 TaxID=3055859 RepID=UPI0025A30885|nr:hypothetical protein [Lysinibacillus sp. G4S2]MDM5246828.1 hypothetical protein [Lysinibacillus sp. G4S2]